MFSFSKLLLKSVFGFYTLLDISQQMLGFIIPLVKSQLNDRGGKQIGERGENKLYRLSEGVLEKLPPGRLPPGRLPPTLTLNQTLTLTQERICRGQSSGGQFSGHHQRDWNLG